MRGQGESSFMSRREIGIAILLFIAGMACRLPFCNDEIFLSDSADYLTAVRSGAVVQYFSTEEVTPLGLLRLYASPEIRNHVWDKLMREGDVSALRHFHSAASFVPHALLNGLGSNRVHRIVSACWGAILGSLIYLILRHAGASQVFSILSALICTLAPPVFETTIGFSPHEVYPVFAIATLYCFSAAIERGSAKLAIISGAGLAVSIATVELAPLLVIAMIVAVIPFRHARERVLDKQLAYPFLTGLGIGLVLAWPGGVFRGGYVVSYGIFAFMALFRRADYFAHVPIQVALLRPFGSGALGFAVYAGLLVGSLALLIRARVSLRLLVFLIYSMGTLVQGIGTSFQNVTYAAEFLIPFSVALAIALHEASTRLGWGKNVLILTSGIVFAIVAWSWPSQIEAFAKTQSTVASRVTEEIAEIRRTIPPGQSILVNNYYSSMRAYLPDYSIEETVDKQSIEARPAFHAASYCKLFDVDVLQSEAKTEVLQSGDACCRGGFSLTCPTLGNPKADRIHDPTGRP
jgi:hypothetical protein